MRGLVDAERQDDHRELSEKLGEVEAGQQVSAYTNHQPLTTNQLTTNH
jgi:hypothetical protein